MSPDSRGIQQSRFYTKFTTWKHKIGIPSSSAHYEYSELPSPYSTIRVLKICPGRDKHIIQGTLVTIPLGSDDHQYTALSYCWGPPAKTNIVVCDGQELPITASLHSALQRLRSLGFATIWADAICIDQSNERERGMQVQIMGQIYKQATRVVCDLGEASGDSDLAIKFLGDMFLSTKNSGGIELIKAQDFEICGLPSVEDEGWKAFVKLISRSWFRRMWVKQEFCLARSPVMLCGMTLLECNQLQRAVSHVRDLGISWELGCGDSRESRIISDCVTEVYSLGAIRKAIAKFGYVSIQRMIRIGYTAEVSDPRDKFYSVMGMSPRLFDRDVYVSYSEPADSVFQRVSRYLVERHGAEQEVGVNILYCATGINDRVPSWIIKWDEDRALRPFTFGGKGLYRASGDTRPQMRIAEDGSSVIVAVSKIDYLETVTSTWNPQITWDELFSWYAEAYAFATDSRDYPTRESIIQAYTTTLVADSTTHTRLDPGALVESYTAYVAPQDWEEIVAGELKTWSRPFQIRCANATRRRRFCVTRKGFFAMIPDKAQAGDLVCILLGGDAPLVLRRDESYGRYILIGDCYLQCIMKGEALEWDGFHVEDFVLKGRVTQIRQESSNLACTYLATTCFSLGAPGPQTPARP